MRYSRSLECFDSRSRVTTGDIQEAKRLNGLVDQDPVQPGIDLVMVEIVVVDELAIELPLVLEKRRRRLVEHISSCSLNFDRLIHIIVTLDPDIFPRIHNVVGLSEPLPIGPRSSLIGFRNRIQLARLVEGFTRG